MDRGCPSRRKRNYERGVLGDMRHTCLTVKRIVTLSLPLPMLTTSRRTGFT